MSEAPREWKFVPLAHVCDVNPRDPGPEDHSTAVSFVPMPAVSDADGVILPHDIKPFTTVAKGYTRFREQDVIFAKITPCMENGKIAIAEGLHGGFACGSTEFHVLRSGPAILPSYLWRFVRQESFRKDAERHMTGAVGQRRVPAQYIKDAVIPVPPIPQQRRIVARLDSLFNRSKSARLELAHIPGLVKRYKQAVLSSVMNADENGHRWPQVPLGDLITEGPTNGYSPRSGENPRGTLSLKLTATTRGVMDLSDRAVKRLNEVIPKDSKFWLCPGDILIQRANSLEYVGMAVIYDGPPQKYIYPDLMIRIRVASSTIGRWIWRYCLSASGRQYFMSNATGTAGNMPKINGATIRKMPIPLPPMDQLEALLGKVDRALDVIDALQGEAGRAQTLLDRLDQATLAKAFRGELTGVNSGRNHVVG
jgi:type I restriction enzyme S subunit